MRKVLTVVQRTVTVSPMGTLTLQILTCLRCRHEWIPRRQEWPKRCAKCGSPYWDRAKD